MSGKDWEAPSVIVTYEKYGDRYLDATTEEAFHRSALGLLRERFDSGDWYPDPGVVGEDDSRDARLYHRWYAVASALSAADPSLPAEDLQGLGARAWRCLLSRAPYEYEGVSLVELETFSSPAVPGER